MHKEKYIFAAVLLLCSSCFLPIDKDSVVTLTIINKTAETISVDTGIVTSFLSDGIRKIDAFKTETLSVKKRSVISVSGDTSGITYGRKIFTQSGCSWIIT